MLFRCRQLVGVLISVGGCQDDPGLPNSADEVMAWVTRGHEARRAIPVFLRSDIGLARADGLTPESDPSHLRIASAGSFEGRAWLSFAVEFFRSRRAFALRLSSILERQGIACKALETSLSAAELKAETVATKAAKAAVERAEAALMAEHAAAASARRQISDRLVMRGARPRLTAEFLAGDAAADLAAAFGVSASAATNADWLWFYRGHVAAYGRARAFFSGQMVNSHEPALVVTTDAQRGELVRALLQAVFGVCIRAQQGQRRIQGRRVLDGGDDVEVPQAAAEFFQTRAAEFASTFGKDGASCRYTVRLCADMTAASHESNRGQLTAKRVVTFSAGALAWFGLKAQPVYARGKGRKKKPEGYTLQWRWTCPKRSEGKLISPPRPFPIEPEKADWQLLPEAKQEQGRVEEANMSDEPEQDEQDLDQPLQTPAHAATGGPRSSNATLQIPGFSTDDDFMPPRQAHAGRKAPRRRSTARPALPSSSSSEREDSPLVASVSGTRPGLSFSTRRRCVLFRT